MVKYFDGVCKACTFYSIDPRDENESCLFNQNYYSNDDNPTYCQLNITNTNCQPAPKIGSIVIK